MTDPQEAAALELAELCDPLILHRTEDGWALLSQVPTGKTVTITSHLADGTELISTRSVLETVAHITAQDLQGVLEQWRTSESIARMVEELG